MISITNLGYFLGDRALFKNASLHIRPKDKIGLIGLNGTGKSTLLRLIMGSIAPSEGNISKGKDCTLGYLDQDLLSYQSKDSILMVAMQAFDKALQVQKQIEATLVEMEQNYTDDLVAKLSKLQESYEAMDGYTLQSKAEEILEGIGFSTSDLERPLEEFSGGWRMRVMLAKLLLEKPSLLMLDEPTNHLDLPSIKWIENYLKSYQGAVIVVSHDRRFLDNIVGSIVEVWNQELHLYPGNYSFYEQEKTLRAEIQQNSYQNQQQKIKQTERFIERFRAKSTKARQVQSRVKSLERMEMINAADDSVAQLNFKFTFTRPSGRFVINLNDISKSYGDQIIFENTSAAIERGDKIALIGANGKGKSTLLRIIAGQEEITGELQPGYNVSMAFYAQHQLEALDMDSEVLEELKQSGFNKTEQELRNLLGCFLFSNDDVFKKIKVLSGGEKSRVALAKTLLSESNFLQLDEPTNHLDIVSVKILIQALQQYQGSFIIVSHDRFFISEVANKIWYIENNQIKEYPGTYEEYEYWRAKNQVQDDVQKAARKKPNQVKPKVSSPNTKELKKAKLQLGKVEKDIEQYEELKLQIEQELSQPEVYSDSEKVQAATLRLKQTEADLANSNEKWEALVETIERLEIQ